jgi:hypothetical protein
MIATLPPVEGERIVFLLVVFVVCCLLCAVAGKG